MGLFGQSCNKIPELSTPPNVLNEIFNVVGTDNVGNPVLLTSIGAQDRVLWLDVGLGKVYWKDISTQLIPAATGFNNGFFFRASGFVQNIGPQGVPYQLAANPGVDNIPGVAAFVSPGDIGKALIINALGVPEFLAIPAGGAVNIAGVSASIDKVRAKSLTVATLNVIADEILVSDGTGAIVLTTVNENVDITASGLNGLDIGFEASSTWYYIYIVSDGNPANVSAMISTGANGPNFGATGYTHWARVGVVRNDGSGNFVSFVQNGEYVAIDSTTMCLAQLVPQLAAPAAIPQTSAAMTTITPPIAKTVNVNIVATCAAALQGLHVGSTNGLLLGQKVAATMTAAGIASGNASDIVIENPVAPQIFWGRTGATAVSGDCFITGYTIQ